MKKLLLLLVALPFFSCIENTDVARTDGNLFEALVSSQWRVNFFENEGMDKTTTSVVFLLIFLVPIRWKLIEAPSCWKRDHGVHP
jgi:hypothetical protein